MRLAPTSYPRIPHLGHRQSSWSGYTPRASDIVISTYPKCGTTWMQRIVGALVFQTPEAMPFSGEISLWIDFLGR